MPKAATKLDDDLQRAQRPWWRERSVHIAVLLWIAGVVIVMAMAHGSLPFNRPILAELPYRAQILIMAFQPVLPFILMAVTYLLTRHRAVPDIAARAPEKSVAARE